jgi:hypothetical protein
MNGHIADNNIDYIFTGLNEKLKSKPQGVDVFFQYYEGRPCCMTMLFMKIMWDFKTPAEFVRYFSKIYVNELCVQALAYYDEYRYNNDAYKDLLADNEKLSVFINSLHLFNDLKTNLILFIENPKPYIINITEIMTYVLIKMRAVFHYKKAETEAFVQKTFSILENDTCLLSLDKEPFVVNLTQYNIINFTVSVINDAVVFILQGEDQLNLCFGIYHEQYTEKSLEYTEQIDLQSIAKALGENLRYKIFNMLNKKNVYGRDSSRFGIAGTCSLLSH